MNGHSVDTGRGRHELPLNRDWSILRFVRRADRISHAMEHGVTFGLSPDEAKRRRDFYLTGDWFIRHLGPVDIRIDNARHECGRLVFDMTWRCLGCGEIGDFDRPTVEDGSHIEDDRVCSCRKCGAIVGRWGDQRQAAEWFAEEFLRYGQLGENPVDCILRHANPAPVALSLKGRSAAASSSIARDTFGHVQMEKMPGASIPTNETLDDGKIQ